MSETAMVWFLVVALSGQGKAVDIHPLPFSSEEACVAAGDAMRGFESRCFPQSVDDVQRGFAAAGGLHYYSKVPAP